MLGEISKHFKFTETHAGFCLGFFVGGKGEVGPERIFLGLLRVSGGMLPQKILRKIVFRIG